MESQALGELRPNITKDFLFNVLKAGTVVAIIIAASMFLNYMINLQDLYNNIQLGFSELGIKFSPPSQTEIMMWITFALFGIAIFILLFNYIALGKVRYVFYSDKLVMYTNFLMLQIKEVAIPYANIVKVSFEKAFLNTSNITLELSGMKKKEIKLKFIDSAEQAVANIQSLLQNYKANYYAQYTRDQSLGNIVGQLG